MTARASRGPLLVATWVALLATSPCAARAQDTTRMAADSLAEMLRRLEAEMATLRQQVGDLATTGSQARSRLRLEWSGRVVVNAFRNERRVNNVDNPQFVRPDSASPLPQSALGLAVRQTRLGLAVFADSVMGARFVGDADVDFYGGQQPSSGGRTFPLVRLRTARLQLRWPNADLLVGQEVPLVAPLNPESPSAVGTPGFVTAGNLWLWLPQVRAGVETGSSESAFRAGLRAAVLAPTTGDFPGAFDTDADAAERSGRPFVQARAHVRSGSEEQVREVGCGVHRGWIAIPGRALRTSHAVACDVRVALLPSLELRGEAYRGQALRGLGGGAVSQNLGVANAAVRTRAAWAQLNLTPSPLWGGGVGCGADDPDDEDLPTAGRQRNAQCAGWLLVRPGGPPFLGVELRRLATRTGGASATNHHLNVAIGFEF